MALFKPNIKKMERNNDIDGLIAAMRHKDPGIRLKATVALGNVGDGRAEEPLKRALCERYLHDEAMEALHTIGCGPPRKWKTLYRDILCSDLMLEKTARGDAETERLVQYGHEEKQVAAAGVLGRIGGERAEDALIEALQGKPQVQRVAIGALGRAKVTRAVEHIIPFLKDAESLTRQSAARALSVLGDARAVELLIEALSDEDDSVRSEAIRALRDMKDKRAVEPLMQLLEDKSTRHEAARVLVSLGDERAAESLLQYVKSATDNALEGIAQVFGVIGQREDGLDAVYAQVARRLDLPKKRAPSSEGHWRGTDVEELIAVLREVVSSKTPTITKAKMSADYEGCRGSWRNPPLHHGTMDDLEAVLRPILDHDLAEKGFMGFVLHTSYFEGYTQIGTDLERGFRAFRLWKTRNTIYFCHSLR
jgi:HEAT repeat protein